MSFTIDSKVKLNNGVEIPLLGLGVYQSEAGEETQSATRYALEAGYRHIDTARLYSNEEDVGKVIRESSIPRKDIFVTTKLWNSDHGYDSTLKAFNGSLERLNIDYIDLYLIHWPVPGVRNDSWKALEKIYSEGKCKAIGVSNYTVRHLRELLEICEVVPAVNQVEFSPYLYQKDLLEYCQSNKIQLEAYSPLTQGKKLKDRTLMNIALKYNKSPAQVLIRWNLQHEVVVIPKSVRKERIIDNANIYDFSLSEDDMKQLDSLNEDFRTCWNPSDQP